MKKVLAGAALALGARALVPKLLKVKFDSDVTKLNSGDYSSLLGAYSEDAVIRFNDGDHRWSGDWKGRAGIEHFLRNFTAAKVQGEIRQIVTSGPPWALTMLVRFDDHAEAPDGTRIYENRTVLVLKTRWGKVVEQEDYYADTGSILEFDRKLDELGVPPVPSAD